MEGGRKEEEKATLAEEGKEDDDDNSETDGAVEGSKGLVIKREEKDLASNQDEAAKGVEEENEPNAEDKSFSASPQSKYSALSSTECMECFRQWTHICAKEKTGDEDNSGRDGGLTIGLI